MATQSRLVSGWGQAVAAQVLEARSNDGAQALDSYRSKSKAGVYIPTALTVGLTWPNLRPFVLTSASQFRPQPPIPLVSKQWAADYNKIKLFGGTYQHSALRQAGRGCPLLAHPGAGHLLSCGATWLQQESLI
jgi:hypothetical protein